MVLHSFPAAQDPSVAFRGHDSSARSLPQSYEDEIVRRAKTGEDETAVRCGMLDIAGVTVGAAFVGTFASTMVVADILRLLHGGTSYSVISVDLRSPAGIQAIPNGAPGGYPDPAYTLSR